MEAEDQRSDTNQVTSWRWVVKVRGTGLYGDETVLIKYEITRIARMKTSANRTLVTFANVKKNAARE